MKGFWSLIKVSCLSNKTAGLAASHVIKNRAVALSPWAIRIPLMIFGITLLEAFNKEK